MPVQLTETSTFLERGDVRPMRHHTITLAATGRPATAREVLLRAGAVSTARPDELVLSVPEAAAVLSEASMSARLIVDRFDVLGEGDVTEVWEHGDVTPIRKRSFTRDPRTERDDDLLPWGMCLDEGGEQLDVAALHAAAERVVSATRDISLRALAPLEAAVAASRAGARLAAAVAPAGEPGELSPEAVLAFAVTVAQIGIRPGTPPGLPARVALDWLLTRANVHAGTEEVWTEPEERCPSRWFGYLLGAASDLVASCLDERAATEVEWANPWEEHYGSPSERRESRAGTVVSECLQAMVLFPAEEQAPAD